MEEKTPFYLWIDAVKGDSTAKGHERWIPVWDYSDDLIVLGNTGGSRLFERILFRCPYDSSVNILIEKQEFNEVMKTAKFDQVSRPKAPATLFTMEAIEIIRVSRANDGGFSFTVKNGNLTAGAGYR